MRRRQKSYLQSYLAVAAAKREQQVPDETRRPVPDDEEHDGIEHGREPVRIDDPVRQRLAEQAAATLLGVTPGSDCASCRKPLKEWMVERKQFDERWGVQYPPSRRRRGNRHWSTDRAIPNQHHRLATAIKKTSMGMREGVGQYVLEDRPVVPKQQRTRSTADGPLVSDTMSKKHRTPADGPLVIDKISKKHRTTAKPRFVIDDNMPRVSDFDNFLLRIHRRVVAEIADGHCGFRVLWRFLRLLGKVDGDDVDIRQSRDYVATAMVTNVQCLARRAAGLDPRRTAGMKLSAKNLKRRESAVPQHARDIISDAALIRGVDARESTMIRSHWFGGVGNTHHVAVAMATRVNVHCLDQSMTQVFTAFPDGHDVVTPLATFPTPDPRDIFFYFVNGNHFNSIVPIGSKNVA